MVRSSNAVLVVLLFSVIFTILLFSPVNAEQSGGAVEVEGYASIVGGRKDQAREAAIQNAFRLAVEQVVGVAVESKTVVKDSELLNDRIFSKSKGFIKTYRILDEKVEADAYRIKLFASVSRHKLERGLDDAGLLIRKMGKPRIAVVVMESNVDARSRPGGLIENHLVNTLGKRGYSLVDRQVMLALEKEAAKAGSDYADAVVRAAAAGGAEVVITGQAVARTAPALSGTNLRPVQVSATCRAIDADTGESLATVVSNQKELNVNPAAAGTEALQKAAVEIAESLNRQIIAAWTKRLTGIRTVKLTLHGIPQKLSLQFQEDLKERIGRVEDLHDRGYKDHKLRLDLDVTGSFKELIDELTTFISDNGTISITAYSAGQMQAVWQGRPTKGGRRK